MNLRGSWTLVSLIRPRQSSVGAAVTMVVAGAGVGAPGGQAFGLFCSLSYPLYLEPGI